MTNRTVGRTGWLAIGVAVLGGAVALVNEAMRYRRGDRLDWGHVALALGVPVLMYAIVRGAARGKSSGEK